jgi:hypothetical protein
MTAESTNFIAERDARTALAVKQGDVETAALRPVAIEVGRDAAACERGQQAALAMANMMARFHRRVSIRAPACTLLRPSLCGGHELEEALLRTASATNPEIELVDGQDPEIIIAITGELHPPSARRWFVGFDGYAARIDRRPSGIDRSPGCSLGAALAACFGAAAAFRLAFDLPVAPAGCSLWTLDPARPAVPGLSSIAPLDVGDVLQVGAGGVGACLDYWLRDIGVVGEWVVVDMDVVSKDNLNRCLPFFGGDVGVNKAKLCAPLIGGVAAPVAYSELKNGGGHRDLALPLANEGGVREAIASRAEPLLLHATTDGASWQAQLHRHIPEIDDCITHRVPSPRDDKPQLECSEGRVSTGEGLSTRASLPFLSATAALLLVTALDRLRNGELTRPRHNEWRLGFLGPAPRLRCAAWPARDSLYMPSRAMRERINRNGRWDRLDPARQGR